MTLDTSTTVGGLEERYPESGDSRTEGDNHIRKIKEVLVADFAAILGPVTASHTELNYLDITTLGTGQASKALTADSSGDVDNSALTYTDLGTVTTVDINGGTIDGATIATSTVAATTLTGATIDGPIGSVTPAAVIGTTIVANDSLDINGTVVCVGTLDDGTMGTATATTLATSESIKTYIDSITLGVGQTWQDVSGSRARNVDYENGTGRPIQVVVSWQLGNGASSSKIEAWANTASPATGGVRVGVVGETGTENHGHMYSLSFIVPAGHWYSIENATGGQAEIEWSELRDTP
jgi:hypothetical protein